MNVTTETTQAQQLSAFSKILVGIDGSEESREAARQAAAIAEGELTLLAAYDTAPAIVGGTGFYVPDYSDLDLQREAAKEALERARDDIAESLPAGKIVRGQSTRALISELEREEDTLLAVGSHGLGRVAGFLLGSTATDVIRKAPCSVLRQRPGMSPDDDVRQPSGLCEHEHDGHDGKRDAADREQPDGAELQRDVAPGSQRLLQLALALCADDQQTDRE
jgi:nucleotide-binding universal stress UspA family protein